MPSGGRAVAALEDQAIKALAGESQLDLAIINQLIPKQKAATKRLARNTSESSW